MKWSNVMELKWNNEMEKRILIMKWNNEMLMLKQIFCK